MFRIWIRQKLKSTLTNLLVRNVDLFTYKFAALSHCVPLLFCAETYIRKSWKVLHLLSSEKYWTTVLYLDLTISYVMKSQKTYCSVSTVQNNKTYLYLMNIRDIDGNINEDLTILVQHVKSYSITSSRRHIGTVQNMLKNKVKKQTKISYLGTGNCTRYVRNFSKKNF